MNSPAFRSALEATGYLDSEGHPAPGMTVSGSEVPPRLRAIITDERVGLKAEAVFSAQGAPANIFKDAGGVPPTASDLRNWYEAAWNVGVAPLLWIVTPTEVRLYDCYATPDELSDTLEPPELERFQLDSPDRLRALDAACGRLTTETGAFWSSHIGSRIDRSHRVDRELLAEISALEDQLVQQTPVDASPRAQALARDIAQRFIGRCIFTWYLLDRGLAQPFLPADLPSDLGQMFATPERALVLFGWLRTTFNGDLFPMDDPGAEREHLTAGHLEPIRDFIEGRSLIPERKGQGRLFRFRFNAIPIDLISSIYQQFARSSALDEANAQSLHYTPVELVHLALDPIFEQFPVGGAVIDPACGSGAFLVEAFRRLVWRESEGRPASRDVVRKVLHEQLFGIDFNRSALGIAAFSLYLAALELDEDPINDLVDLKFDRLIGRTLFEANSLGPLPDQITSTEFAAVVGNPPWTFVSQSEATAKPASQDDDAPRPRRSPDWAFLNLAARLAGQNGRVGMVMKATPFFSKDKQAVVARSDLLQRMAPTALINLSCLRREKLFPDAVGPALLFLARCALSTTKDRMLVGSIPWTPDFRRTGVFNVGPSEIRSIPLDKVLSIAPFLKAATFGSVRDGWLIERLEREFPTLGDALDRIGLKARTHRGQGFKVKGKWQTASPADYFDLKVVTPNNFTPFRLHGALDAFDHRTLHRPRSRAIFKGPLLLCSKVGSEVAAQRGRYSSAVVDVDRLYTESFFGISFADADTRFAYVLSGILNSSLTSFQCALGGPTWGLERPTVQPHDLLSLRVPHFASIDDSLIDALISAEQAAAQHLGDLEKLRMLDRAVFDIYDLEPEEAVLASGAVDQARYLIFENRAERAGFVLSADDGDVRRYARQVVATVDAYLRSRGERHLEAYVYGGKLIAPDSDGIPGVTAVRLSMASGAPDAAPVVRDGDRADLASLAQLLRGRFEADIPPYLNERRQLRIYSDDSLFILKPSERRYWTQTIGLNDADVILADHWLQRCDGAPRT